MKKYVTFLCFLLLFFNSTTSHAAPFTSLNSTTESGIAIASLAERELLPTLEDWQVHPKKTLTRAEAAFIISNVLKLQPTYFIETYYSDVAKDSPYYDAIIAVSELEIMRGYSDQTFRPNHSLTRAQAAKIISEAFRLHAELEKLPFIDINSQETKHYVSNLYAHKVTIRHKQFFPNKTITRAQFSLFITRAEKVKAAYTMYSFHENFTAFGYTEYDEDVVKVQLDLHRLTLHPIKEGTARIVLYTMNEMEEFNRLFYVIHVKKVHGTFEISMEPESIYDYISYATSIYHYHDGLYLNFVPKSVEILTEEGLPVSPDQYDIILDGEEVQVTMYRDGAFQLYFSNETERSTHALLSTIENFLLDFSIETISPFIKITNEDFSFTMVSANIADYLTYGDANTPPFTVRFENGELLITPLQLGEGVVRVIDSTGTKHYIDVIIHEKAGILVVDADLE